MVPARSDKVSRVSSYSGYRSVSLSFAYGAFTLSGRLSQSRSAGLPESGLRSEPRNARIPVWEVSECFVNAQIKGKTFGFATIKYYLCC